MAFEIIWQAVVNPFLSDGTVAACLYSGMNAGLFDENLPRAWAFQVIEGRAQPPIEIIEVATARHGSDLCKALSEVRGHRDEQLAAHILLHHIYIELASARMHALAAASAAMQIARPPLFSERIYFDFMRLREDLHLALDGVTGVVSELAEDLLSLLRLNMQQ